MGNPNPSPETRFKKGQSGNPSGRKNLETQGLTKKVRQQAEELCATKEGKMMSRAEAIAQVVWKLAINDQDLDAIKFIFDRLDGKVPSKLQVEGQSVRFAFDEDVIGSGLGPERGTNGQDTETASGTG